MDYVELTYTIHPFKQEFADILIAQLADMGYESFVETETGLLAYIQHPEFDVEAVEQLITPWAKNTKLSFHHKIIKDKNWNAEWERNYQSVAIAEKCLIRAPFHSPDPGMAYDIIIEPKMSFGTAHHATTALMIEFLLQENLKGQNVLDMGCGTAVLAILSQKRGANSIDAIDNDEWAYNNAICNIEKNKTKFVNVHYGDAALLKDKQYDLILANINRNILIKDMTTYRNSLNQNASLIMSGFYEKDLAVIIKHAESLGLLYARHQSKDGWVAVKFNTR